MEYTGYSQLSYDLRTITVTIITHTVFSIFGLISSEKNPGDRIFELEPINNQTRHTSIATVVYDILKYVHISYYIATAQYLLSAPFPHP